MKTLSGPQKTRLLGGLVGILRAVGVPSGDYFRAAAQQKRWAEKKGNTGGAGMKAGAKAKRQMSAEGRKAIAEATRKRWEAYRAEKSARAK